MKIYKILFLFWFLLVIPLVSYAHYPLPPNSGSESQGYIVDPTDHAGKSGPINYRFDLTINSTNKSHSRTSANGWSSSPVTFIESCCFGTGTLGQYNDSNTSTVAVFTEYTSNSSVHLTSWIIRINQVQFSGLDTNSRNKVMTHEFGHAVGLNDLYHSGNKGKLMYGYVDELANNPTSHDNIGALESSK